MLSLKIIFVLLPLGFLLLFALIIRNDLLIVLLFAQYVVFTLVLSTLLGVEGLRENLTCMLLLLTDFLIGFLGLSIHGVLDYHELATPFLLLADTLRLLLLHLFDEHLLAEPLCRDTSRRPFFIVLDELEALYLHHLLEGLLLVDIFSLESVILLDLLVPNVLHLAKHHALVHFLDVVDLLVQLNFVLG